MKGNFDKVILYVDHANPRKRLASRASSGTCAERKANYRVFQRKDSCVEVIVRMDVCEYVFQWF